MKCWNCVMIDGKARGIIARNLVTGELEQTFRSCCIVMYGRLWKCFLFVHQCHGVQCYGNLEST